MYLLRELYLFSVLFFWIFLLGCGLAMTGITWNTLHRIGLQWPFFTQRGREIENWYDTQVADDLEADAEAWGLDHQEILRLRREIIWKAIYC
jgi:hypothetical protein